MEEMHDALEWLLYKGYVEMIGFDKDGEMLYQITPTGERYLSAGIRAMDYIDRFQIRPEQMN
jgi:hypothetical protein